MKEGAAKITELPKFVCAAAFKAQNTRHPAKTETYFIVYFPQTKECPPACCSNSERLAKAMSTRLIECAARESPVPKDSKTCGFGPQASPTAALVH